MKSNTAFLSVEHHIYTNIYRLYFLKTKRRTEILKINLGQVSHFKDVQV